MQRWRRRGDEAGHLRGARSKGPGAAGDQDARAGVSPAGHGPEYTLPGRLERLRDRGLGGKRAVALRKCALGLEALHRFIAGEPLRRVQKCAFGVLALESEPIDPRW